VKKHKAHYTFLKKTEKTFGQSKKSLPLTDFSRHSIQHAQDFWQIGLSEHQGT